MQRNDPKVYEFYQSRAWKKTRNLYIKYKFGLCERCNKPGTYVHHKKYITSSNVNDKDITLNWNNLELLCHECHNKEHFTSVSYKFDNDGNLIMNNTIKMNRALT